MRLAWSASPMTKLTIRTLAASSLALALVGGAACGKTGSANEAPKPVETAKPGETAKPAEAPKPAELAKPDFTISARDLYAEFRPQIEAGTADAVRAVSEGWEIGPQLKDCVVVK